MPYSKIKSHIAEILQQQGTSPAGRWECRGGQEARDQPQVRQLPRALDRRYQAGVQPGLRVYAKKDNLPKVLGGLGVAIISTSNA